jgi:hypothetical protein
MCAKKLMSFWDFLIHFSYRQLPIAKMALSENKPFPTNILTLWLKNGLGNKASVIITKILAMNN